MSGTFTDASRTVCRREVLAGEVHGAAAVAVRFTELQNAEKIREVIKDFSEAPSLARAELWTSDEQPGEGAMAEEAIRGPDAKIASCLLLEFLRDPDAQAAVDQLRPILEGGNIGVYRLLCERVRAD